MKKNKLAIEKFSMNQMGRNQMIHISGGEGGDDDDSGTIIGDPLVGQGNGGGIIPGSSGVTSPLIPNFPIGGSGVTNPPKTTTPTT